MNIRKIIDLTHVLIDNMPVHPESRSPRLIKTNTFGPDAFSHWNIESGMHVGTHIDGPAHISNSTTLISQIPIQQFVGTGVLVDVRGAEHIDAGVLAGLPDEPDLIVLFYSGRDKYFNDQSYFSDYPVLTPACAHELVRRQVKMIGIDFYSPDQHPYEIHQILFAHNILIAENLVHLDALVNVSVFTVVALPLKTETDSALARVIALV